MNDKCNCGKEARYVFFVNGEHVGACNKNGLCKSYEELEAENKKLKVVLNSSLKCANDLSNYVSHSSFYHKAKDRIDRLINEYEVRV